MNILKKQHDSMLLLIQLLENDGIDCSNKRLDLLRLEAMILEQGDCENVSNDELERLEVFILRPLTITKQVA
jgi:hypothetical protein